MQGVSDRSCFDGWLHDRGDIQSRADQMVGMNVDGGVRGFD